MRRHNELVTVWSSQNNVLVEFAAELITEFENRAGGLSQTCNKRTLIDILAGETEETSRDSKAKLDIFCILVGDIPQDRAPTVYCRTRKRTAKRRRRQRGLIGCNRGDGNGPSYTDTGCK
jgi:hypothetical protein